MTVEASTSETSYCPVSPLGYGWLPMRLKSALMSVPLVGRLALALKHARFGGSADYWEKRYATGGNSGAGSYNRLAHFKADFLNEFVKRHRIASVVEFGSGDGAQLELADYPDYVGVDISSTILDAVKRRFAADGRIRFLHASEVPAHLSAELALSLDVIYHLVEDDTFDAYMRQLFAAGSRFVIAYSSNAERPSSSPHVRHRRFTDWVEANRPDFRLAAHVPNAFPEDVSDPHNTSYADFYVFERQA